MEQKLTFRAPPSRSIKEAAKALSTTPAKLKRLIKVAKEEGLTGLSKARWGRGKKCHDTVLEDNEIDWLIDQRTLISQVGLSLNARREQFNQHWERQLGAAHFRELYR